MKTLLLSMRETVTTNHGEIRNSIDYRYIEFFEDLGFNIILIPNNTSNIEYYFQKNIDLIVLSGGNNVNPNLYYSNEKLSDLSFKRDNTETMLLEHAIKNKIFVLGICRGFQFINVYFNGKLSHNVEYHVNKNHQLTSNICLLNGIKVNSYHNQAVMKDDLAGELEEIACVDETVEAFINRKKNILGIQWHPERQSNTLDKQLILKFLGQEI